jgi:uncharacterized membrane-anchored protein YitT (DUF2179 family)
MLTILVAPKVTAAVFPSQAQVAMQTYTSTLTAEVHALVRRVITTKITSLIRVFESEAGRYATMLILSCNFLVLVRSVAFSLHASNYYYI